MTAVDGSLKGLRVSGGGPEAGGESRVYDDCTLCDRCQKLDITGTFQNYGKAKDCFGEYVVNDLGNVEAMRKSQCQLCHFFASMALEKQTDHTCDCFLNQKSHTFPSFKTKNYELRAMTVGHAYLGQEFAKMARPNVAGLQKQVMLGLSPKTGSEIDDENTAHHCWYRIGMIAGSISTGDASWSTKKKRWNLLTRKISPLHIPYDILTGWLNVCQDDHDDECQNDTQDVAPCVKVIDCKTKEIVKTPQRCQYFALSYVWGRTQELSPGPVKKESGGSTILEMPDSLPLTVSDAIEVVQRLGFRYLWVDKYCIDQENLQEKMSQIQCMDLIYEHCTAVIVAAAGTDSSYGLPGVTTRARVSQPAVTAKGITMCSTLPNPVYTIRRSTWMTRGWTYQEAVFPKRRLYFTDHQVVFECSEVLFTEVFDHPADVKVQQYQHDSEIFATTDMSEFDSPMMLRYGISSHIEAFSSRNVTHEADALNALLGVFQRLQRAKSSVRQFFGLPIQHAALSHSRFGGEMALPGDASDIGDESSAEFKPRHLGASGVLAAALHWYHEPGSAFEMRAIQRRLTFPSWTWLGWTKKVKWSADLPLDETNDIQIDVEDKEGRLWPWDTSKNAEAVMANLDLMSGRLRIKGWLVRAKITSVLSGNHRRFSVSREGQRDEELYVSLGRSAAPPSSGGDKGEPNDFYRRLLDKKIEWELLSLGPSEPLILLKDEGNGQFSRIGATQKTKENYEKSKRKDGGSDRRKTEFWLI
jgi:hypothetical protein